MSSGTPKTWKPTTFPADPEATHQLQEWLAEDGYSLFGFERDFRGADLSGGDFTQAWFTQANLAGVRLRGASFYRADLQSANLTGADLTGADLVRANLNEAVLCSARLDGADMVKASLHDVNASRASFRRARIMAASLFDVDMRGADLTDAVLSDNVFQVTVDDSTVVRGLTGTVFGPITVDSGDSSLELGGADLEAWINARGGQVQVIPPRGQMRPAHLG
ncbi:MULTISPECIES: pentapeptide repeat-containing protein [unclassified Streptomyces]|uniref:pentapeptide repeat-containing protein n=1 Tax=unclassified Streptomyces TaxID=2593676 RepID=UPI000DABEEAD|nr:MULTISPECIES: pentapeptide repeat-containing protein [unclassified Streptomyces]PZT77347.1 pentapeptide repeat-containing protein [Streptomyces sp. AC1-42W]PZT78701.1 pentapeptide repeat-containing protein [Streptomyces sp. AC1-42T]